ncbi:phage holin family protein [Algoriphagus aquimarinus]|uniref:phage holin family protein n=1 Tax=Algoriphagus aquimarinus TaxID=237018 RepID=UPI0030D81696|tara:strand:- start:45793 stop:46308 length:516 start_codon:yes stop_codon:yes gene_type:complete
MYGFKNLTELSNCLFKSVDTVLIAKYLIPFFLIVDSFFTWLFVSTGGIYFLMILFVIDFLTGIAKATYYSLKIKKLKQQGLETPIEFEDRKLVSKKFPRFLITMLCSVMLLALLQFAGVYSLVFIPLYSIFYAVFVGQNLISITENLSEVGVVSAKIVSKLKQKITDILDK